MQSDKKKFTFEIAANICVMANIFSKFILPLLIVYSINDFFCYQEKKKNIQKENISQSRNSCVKSLMTYDHTDINSILL